MHTRTVAHRHCFRHACAAARTVPHTHALLHARTHCCMYMLLHTLLLAHTPLHAHMHCCMCTHAAAHAHTLLHTHTLLHAHMHAAVRAHTCCHIRTSLHACTPLQANSHCHRQTHAAAHTHAPLQTHAAACTHALLHSHTPCTAARTPAPLQFTLHTRTPLHCIHCDAATLAQRAHTRAQAHAHALCGPRSSALPRPFCCAPAVGGGLAQPTLGAASAETPPFHCASGEMRRAAAAWLGAP